VESAEQLAKSMGVSAGMDVSNSLDGMPVSDQEIAQFLAEVQSILGAYPHIDCKLYYADADLHGPYKLDRFDEIPPPKGGGGTSFKPFFRAVDEMASSQEDDLCIYLTDGFGDFPDTAPDYPVMWVLVPGGANDAAFPFGDILRLI
jgi:predicted metal-dependent peptidase